MYCIFFDLKNAICYYAYFIKLYLYNNSCRVNMLGLILESILLIMNAVAILNEKRFLKKCTFIHNNRWF